MHSPVALWRRLTTPTTDGDLARRQEAVLLNVLVGLGALSLITQLVQLAKIATGAGLAGILWWGINVCFFASVVTLVRMTRRGRPRLAAGILIAILGALDFAVLVDGGIANPMWSLVLGLCVILGVILLGTREGLAIAVGGGTVAVAAATFTELGGFEPLNSARASGSVVADGVAILAVLSFIAGVCVLHVREIGTSIDQLLTHGAAQSPLRQLRTSSLSVREVEVVRLIAEGLTDGEIAKKLFISPRTVQTHVRNAREKTESANRTVLGVLALREGLVPLDPETNLSRNPS